MTGIPKKFTRIEKAAWNSSAAVIEGFLGNHKAKNFMGLVETLMKSHGKMACRMFLKVHALDVHVDKFKNMGGILTQGEHFHQNILDFEYCYQRSYET